MELEIRPVSVADVSAATDVLAEASAWLRSKNVHQWPERFPEQLISATAERGELFVAIEGGDVVGTITLQWSDPLFWGERADAGFVHRLAVRRSHAGIGNSLIDWADQQTEDRGRPFLCLDTMTTNRRLRDYYEAAGFEEVGQINGPAGHPYVGVHGPWQATLYQRPVGRYRQSSTIPTLTTNG